MKITWCTDIHLNFLNDFKIRELCRRLQKSEGGAIVITGDISEQETLSKHLGMLATHVNKPIYFVLGNHDFWDRQYYKLASIADMPYQSDIKDTRALCKKAIVEYPNLYYCPLLAPMKLTDDIWITGQDGWYDFGWGQFMPFKVYMNDWNYITDLNPMYDKQFKRPWNDLPISARCAKFAKSEALKMARKLNKVLQYNPKKVVILTHVPPFQENALYGESRSSYEVIGCYTSKMIGDLLLRIAKANPTVDFLVLSGHTHSSAEYSPVSNLRSWTGKSEYDNPALSIKEIEV